MPLLDIQNIDSRNITIEVFGLGYIGLPLAVKLAAQRFNVVGIDKDKSKIQRLDQKRLLDSEKFLEKDLEFFGKTIQFSSNISNDDNQKIAIVCVPTPIPTKDIPSDIYVIDAVEWFLSHAKKGDMIIIESSVEIGTTENVKKVIESKGFKVGEDFGLAFCPERIDPKNKKWNLENIPRIIYCSDNSTFRICQKIYKSINNANLTRVSSPKTAEVVKSFENTFRLVNISLVNELAILCDKLKIDVREIIDAANTKPFGFMPFYPSAGAGGHCIPKDPQFLLESGKKFGVKLETLESALAKNIEIARYISNEISIIIEKNDLPKSVIICGLAYKPDIEDMRDSAGFRILSNLIKKGVRVATFDPYYSEEHKEKYVIENKLDAETSKFEVLDNISRESIKEFGCLCIVQHHTKTKLDIQQILKDKSIPFIYDCQGKLEDTDSIIVKKFGS